MLIKDLIGIQTTKVVVDEVELWLKKLNWKELNEFQEHSKKFEEGEDVDEAKVIFETAKYILLNFTFDKNNEKVIEEEDIEKLPVRFCAMVVEQFFKLVYSNTEDDIKKK